MTALTVWKFDSATGVGGTLIKLEELVFKKLLDALSS